MDTDYHLFGIHATTIAYMNTNRPGNVKAPSDFGSWLRSQITSRKMTQKEFADAIGVSPTSVSRWIKHGDRPKAEHIDPISDVLVLDYDLVATRAGYRPKELMLEVDPTSPEGQLIPLIRKVKWSEGEIERAKSYFETVIRLNAKEGA